VRQPGRRVRPKQQTIDVLPGIGGRRSARLGCEVLVDQTISILRADFGTFVNSGAGVPAWRISARFRCEEPDAMCRTPLD